MEELIKELPEKAEVEEVIAEGRTFSHEEAMERLLKKWHNSNPV
ncbi:MAG: hypothetical protein NUV76_09240 [Candidatus Kuenenia sp.]|nr:hypothetical protein [Candidatus Kuenenia sp.]